MHTLFPGTVEYTYPSKDKGISARAYQTQAKTSSGEVLAAQARQQSSAKEGDFFSELVDAVNPLHHLPGVSTLYHNAIDDPISTFSQLAGGLLFGGPVGFVAAAINAALENDTGKNLPEHVLAMFDGVNSSTQVVTNQQQSLDIEA